MEKITIEDKLTQSIFLIERLVREMVALRRGIDALPASSQRSMLAARISSVHLAAHQFLRGGAEAAGGAAGGGNGEGDTAWADEDPPTSPGTPTAKRISSVRAKAGVAEAGLSERVDLREGKGTGT